MNSVVETTSPPRNDQRTKAWALTGMLVVMYIFNYADKAVFGIIAKPLRQELGLSPAQIGLVGSLFFAAFTVGGFFAGAINRWLTLKWGLMALALCWSAAMLPMLVTASLAVLIVSRMFLGATEGPSSALLHTAAYSWHKPQDRGLPGALLAGAAAIAKIAFAPALTYVVVHHGWRASLMVLAVCTLVWAVAWINVWSPGPYVSQTKHASPTDEPRVPWRTILLSKTFLIGALVVAAGYALVTVVLTWLPSYFEEGLGYSQLTAGAMFALPSIFGLIVLLISSVVSDRAMKRGSSARAVRIILPSAGLILCAIALVAIPYVHTPIVSVLLLSIGYGFVTAIFPLFNAAVADLCPPSQVAGTVGTFLALMAVGGLIAPYMTGVLVEQHADKADGYAAAFQAIGIVAGISAVLAILFVNPDRDSAQIRNDA
ncbi:MFS transporter [Gordonia sp. TBRC 11910]|uniref:MFS transporter n=1 Tax=Gordonia asplenii TaxID=2725283 RepID=A0A848KT38_9ACTN|nr:MFS transporter [Gordonia asplenii]NMO00045.1 MFS transporter [Gordonia asplenii]